MTSNEQNSDRLDQALWETFWRGFAWGAIGITLIVLGGTAALMWVA